MCWLRSQFGEVLIQKPQQVLQSTSMSSRRKYILRKPHARKLTQSKLLFRSISLVEHQQHGHLAAVQAHCDITIYRSEMFPAIADEKNQVCRRHSYVGFSRHLSRKAIIYRSANATCIHHQCLKICVAKGSAQSISRYSRLVVNDSNFSCCQAIKEG